MKYAEKNEIDFQWKKRKKEIKKEGLWVQNSNGLNNEHVNM